MTIQTAERQSISDPALFSLIQRLADNKYWLGRRYAEWCTAAPTLESAVAAAAMSQDEIGHARSHYPLFRQFVGQDIEPEDIEEFLSMTCLDEPFQSWVDFVAANFLVDTALSILYESAQASSYDDLRNRARRITGEEYIHWLHAGGWVRRLAAESEAAKQSLQTALDRLWVECLMWFGASDDATVAELVERGVISRWPDELRADFEARVQPSLDAAGIQIAESQPGLPWDRWDSVRYRLR